MMSPREIRWLAAGSSVVVVLVYSLVLTRNHLLITSPFVLPLNAAVLVILLCIGGHLWNLRHGVAKQSHTLAVLIWGALGALVLVSLLTLLQRWLFA